MNESHRVFMEVQQSNKYSRPQLIKLSRKYRSILGASVGELKSSIESDIVEDEASRQQMEILQLMEIIWNLCEILFFENSPPGVILSRLAEWVKWHFTRADDFTEECIQTDHPHTHILFWSAIKCLVLQGRTEDAKNLLKLHPLCQGEENSYTSMEELLRKMPGFSFCRGQSLVEFEMKWRHWQGECVRRYKDGEFCGDDNLEEIAMILCGELDVFENPEFGGWYEMMVARLIYTKPTVSSMELKHHSKISVDVFGGRNHIGAFDEILMAAFELDPYLVIKECSVRFNNWWLAAHLSDLFHHAGLIAHKKSDFDFREHLVLEYANGLMAHPSFWKVTIDYLAACSDNGNDFVPLFIQKIPLTSEKKAAKILQICKKRKLHSEMRSICRQMSVSARRAGQLGTALMWSLRSSDSTQAMKIAEEMLAKYAESGEFACVDMLDYLGPNVLLSEQLAFLAKYRDFHKLLGEDKLKFAGELLYNLITSNVAPPSFRPSLLLEAMSLLECDRLIFNYRETGDLICSLNGIDLSAQENAEMETRLGRLRLSLARNLSKAVVDT